MRSGKRSLFDVRLGIGREIDGHFREYQASHRLFEKSARCYTLMYNFWQRHCFSGYTTHGVINQWQLFLRIGPVYTGNSKYTALALKKWRKKVLDDFPVLEKVLWPESIISNHWKVHATCLDWFEIKVVFMCWPIFSIGPVVSSILSLDSANSKSL